MKFLNEEKKDMAYVKVRSLNDAVSAIVLFHNHNVDGK